MALTMINPASSWLKVVELPTITQLMTRTVNGKERTIEEEIFDKSSDQISRLVNKIWLCRCWSPNWNEPQTDSGTPRFGLLTNPYPNRFGDPRSDMGSPFWVPFQFGDKFSWSPNWNEPQTDSGSWLKNPQNDSGIPVLVWGCIDPHFGSGIPESVWGFLWFASPFRFGDPRFGLGIPKPKRGSPN